MPARASAFLRQMQELPRGRALTSPLKPNAGLHAPSAIQTHPLPNNPTLR
jgi:hypothetical protein